MKTIISAARANEIQKAWMELDCNAPEKEKQKVFSMMKELPSSHISENSKHGLAQVILQGQPTHAFPEPIEKAVIRAKEMGVQTDLIWVCAGFWREGKAAQS